MNFLLCVQARYVEIWRVAQVICCPGTIYALSGILVTLLQALLIYFED